MMTEYSGRSAHPRSLLVEQQAVIRFTFRWHFHTIVIRQAIHCLKCLCIWNLEKNAVNNAIFFLICCCKCHCEHVLLMLTLSCITFDVSFSVRERLLMLRCDHCSVKVYSINCCFASLSDPRKIDCKGSYLIGSLIS